MFQRTLSLLLCILAVLCVPGGTARAASDEARQALTEAEKAERDLDFASAERAWAHLLRLDPRGRLGRRAASRLDWLRSHGAGDYRSLTELERLRRSHDVTPQAVAAFEAEVPRIDNALLRREARALVAESYLRMNRPLDAVRAHEAWLAEPGLPDADWLRAANGLALARARLGDLGGALDTLQKRGLGGRVEATELRLHLVARVARPASVASLAVFLLLAVGAGVARRPEWEKLRAAFSAPRFLAVVWVLGVPLALASQHRPETWRTLLLLVPGASIVLALAAFAGSALDGASTRRRVVVATFAVLAQVAVAYLALDRSGALLGWALALGLG